MNEFLFIDEDKQECDFCNEQKICASIDWMNKAVFIICKDCLNNFSKKFNDGETN